jgi:hypothetical protein
MRMQTGHLALFVALTSLMWLCPAASAQVARQYQFPIWYGRGCYSVVVDVSDVEVDNYYEMAGRAQEIVGLIHRARANCLVIEDDSLFEPPTSRYHQVTYDPAPTYAQIASKLGLATGLALPSVGPNPSDEERSDWVRQVQEVIHRGDFDYIAVPDSESVSSFKDGPLEQLYRRGKREYLRNNEWPQDSLLERREWRVLWLPEKARTDESLDFAVVGTTEEAWRQAEQPRRASAIRGADEIEVTLAEGEDASRRLIDLLVDVAGHTSNTRLRLRLTLRKDGTIDDAKFATLQEVANWMEVYGRPWEHRHISPPGSATQQVLEVSEGLRVVEGSSKIWVVGDAWPDGGIRLPKLDRDNAHEVVAVRLVGTQEMLRWEQGDEWGTGLTIQPPEEMPNNLPWVVEIDYMNTVP